MPKLQFRSSGPSVWLRTTQLQKPAPAPKRHRRRNSLSLSLSLRTTIGYVGTPSPGNHLQFYRGPFNLMPILKPGEPGWSTDTNQLYIGDGGTNHLIGGDIQRIQGYDPNQIQVLGHGNFTNGQATVLMWINVGTC